LENDQNIKLFDENPSDSDIASVDLSQDIQKLKKQKEEAELLAENENEPGEKKERFENFEAFAERRQESGNESGLNLDDNAEAQEVEPLLYSFVNYANDTLSLLYTPFFVALLWMFYEETLVAKLYGIKIQDFVYYFLFSLVIIPFQISIDIFFHNIMEWYHYLPVHDYLDYMKFRFQNRKARWKGNEPFINQQITDNLRSLDQLCFSSQHYFVLTLYVAGMTQVILGIQVLLWIEYNAFADIATLAVVLFMTTLCFAIHRLCLFFGKLLGIWKIDETMEKLETKEAQTTLANQFQIIIEPEKYGNQRGQEPTPLRVHFDQAHWRNVERIRVEEEVNRNELQTDRVVAETFRDVFIRYNKPWLHEQIHEIFSPRTLFLYRKDIIN